MDGIRNNFKILKAQKEVADGKSYSYEEIYEACGVSPNTLTAYNKGKVTQFAGKTLVALCDWLDCDLSDLISYSPK